MIIKAVSLDFADTLFPHRAREMDAMLQVVADYLHAHVPPFEFARLRDKYMEIRDRQFAQNRATLRENDFAARIAETAAYLSAAQTVDPAALEGAVDAYADAFFQTMRMPQWLPEVLEALAFRYKLAVVSNYPLAAPIFRTLRENGLNNYLTTTVVSADIGFIKPHPAIFDAALAGLGLPPAQVIHVGDDWHADIIGASQAGMHAIYTRQWRDTEDKHYNTGGVTPFAEIDDLRELPPLLERVRENEVI